MGKKSSTNQRDVLAQALQLIYLSEKMWAVERDGKKVPWWEWKQTVEIAFKEAGMKLRKRGKFNQQRY